MSSAIRRMYTSFRIKERAMRGVLLRKLGLQKQVWSHGLLDELQYWQRALAPGSKEGYDNRFLPDLELEDCFKELITVPPGGTIRILDVGAGPVTSVGKKWGDRKIEITPIDPLAEPYEKLLREMKRLPPVLTQKGDGEKIAQLFPPDHFDFVHSRNAIDHSYDPMLIIRQMVEVLKPGCYVYLFHVRNVADMEEHRGLHQWNFDIRDERFIIAGMKETVWVDAELKGIAEVKVKEDNSIPGFPSVIATICKLPH